LTRELVAYSVTRLNTFKCVWICGDENLKSEQNGRFASFGFDLPEPPASFVSRLFRMMSTSLLMTTTKLKRASMGDVARLATVSKATVSAVLNGTGMVKESTRERVLTAIELLNYRSAPVMTGRTNAVGQKSLGLIIKEVDNPYYAEVILGARVIAEANGYSLFVASSEGQYESERRAVALMRAKGIDGLIVTPVLHAGSDLSHLFDLKRRNFPFVLIEQVLGVQASLVDVENVDASRHAVEFLIAQGHTRIVYFAGPTYSMHTQERVDGTRRACGAAHLIFTDDHIVRAGAHLADGYRAGLAYFTAVSAESRPTAVICYNDLVAAGLYRALAELGLRVPDDVSVIGFDDIPLAEYLSVPLTTVRMPKARMGEIAAQMLIQHVEAHTVLPPQRAMLESELIVRASVRRITA
jgi:LacI family transcriptional regulator/LacI family repressor for deo operon, udp, cdd, tsx, nupC, and nupG